MMQDIHRRVREGGTMKKFRRHVAVAIDGGGIKGVMVAQALALLEERLEKPCNGIFQLAAGTSTGSLIAAGIAAGLSASRILDLYVQHGREVFPRTWRYYLWPLARYKYSSDPLIRILQKELGQTTMGDLWKRNPRLDVVITTRDLAENRTRFIKPWKKEYRDWTVRQAVLASSSVPSFFPVVDGRYVDGGAGSYGNPCYLAAYEASFCLGWDPRETTLLSFGTGRSPSAVKPHAANRFFPWQWLYPLFDTFLSDASDQQVRIVRQFFQDLDFRRFQVDMEPIDMDDVTKIDTLTDYGRQMGRMLLNGETDGYAIRPHGRV
jgi:hypothetical protein